MLYGLLLTFVLHLICRCDTARCYDRTCYSENCLQEAIAANTVTTCEMNEAFGCSYTKMTTGSVLIVASCDITRCSPYYSAPIHETLCCSDNRCNNGTHIPDKSTKTHCHAYSCTSGWDCLQQGISAGYSRTCPLDPLYGCYVLKSQSGKITSVRADCSKSPCRSVISQVGDNKMEYTCCSGNMCNDGNNKDGVYFAAPNFYATVCLGILTFLLF